MHLESFPLFVHIAWEPWSALWLIVFHLGLRKVRRTGIIGSRFKNSHGCKRWCYMTVGPDAAAAVAAAEADFKKIPVSSPERKNHGAIMPRKAWEQKSFSVPRNSSENPPNTYQSLQKAYNTVQIRGGRRLNRQNVRKAGKDTRAYLQAYVMEKLFPILTISTCGTSLGMSWWWERAKRKTSYSCDSVGNNPPVEQQRTRS